MRRLILRAVVALGVLMPSVAAAQEVCTPETEAAKLPALSALLDSANLIANLPPPALAAGKELFVRVTPGSEPRVVVMDSVAAKTQTGQVLGEKILASLKPDAKNLLPVFRLRVRLGEAPAVAVMPALDCPPPGR